MSDFESEFKEGDIVIYHEPSMGIRAPAVVFFVRYRDRECVSYDLWFKRDDGDVLMKECPLENVFPLSAVDRLGAIVAP